MANINPVDGRPVAGYKAVILSIKDILLTPKGSRVTNREYGSDIKKLVGKNITVKKIRLEAVTAIKRWEPRFKVKRVDVTGFFGGRVRVEIEGIYKPNNKMIKLGVDF